MNQAHIARRAVVGGFVALAVFASSCGRGHDNLPLAAQSASCTSTNDVPAEGGPQGALHGTRIPAPKSLDAMAAASDAIVRATATANVRVEVVHDIPFSRTTVDVVEVLKGSGINVGDAIEVSQTGSRQAADRNDPPLLDACSEYVLYLKAGTGDSETSYWPTAASGVFGVTDGVLTHLDPKSALADAEKQLPLPEWREKVLAAQ